jgi:hypothetical protein
MVGTIVTTCKTIRFTDIVVAFHGNLVLLKPWFDEECLKLVDRRKPAKLQWLQDPSIMNEDNLRNVRRDASRRFRNKKRENLKVKITDIELNSNNTNIRYLYKGITEFK